MLHLSIPIKKNSINHSGIGASCEIHPSFQLFHFTHILFPLYVTNLFMNLLIHCPKKNYPHVTEIWLNQIYSEASPLLVIDAYSRVSVHKIAFLERLLKRYI